MDQYEEEYEGPVDVKRGRYVTNSWYWSKPTKTGTKPKNRRNSYYR